MRFRRLGGLRARLAALLLLGGLPAAILLVTSHLAERRDAEARTRAEAVRLARLAARDQARLVESVRHLLVALARRPWARTLDPARCGEELAGLLPTVPGLLNLGLARADGLVVCSAVDGRTGTSIAHRRYFREALATGRFAIGDYQIGLLTRAASVNVAEPVAEAGQVVGVAFAALDLAWLYGVAAEAQLPDGSVLLVVDESQTVLVRHPPQADLVGRPAEPSLRRFLERTHDGIAVLTGADGVERLYAAARVRDGFDSGLQVAVGLPTATVLAPATRRLYRHLLLLAGIWAGALGALWLLAHAAVLRPARALAAAARRIAARDIGARVGPPYPSGEIGEASRAFDEMAAALEHQKQLVERVLEDLSDGVLAVDASGGITTVNRTLRDWLDIDRRPAPLGDWPAAYGVCRPDGTPLERGELPIVRALAGERVQGVELLLAPPERPRRRVLASAVPLRAPDGSRLGAVAAFADVSERLQAETRIRRQVSRLAALRAIDLAIAGSLDLRVILGVVLDEVAAQLRADAAEILRVDPATRRLEHAAGRGLTRGIARPQRPDEGLVGAVVRERRILRADAVPGRPGYPLPPLAVLEGFRTCHAAPLVTKGEVCGVLEVFHRSDFVPDEDWLEFLEALAGQAAIAMENATLFERLQRSHADLVRAYDTTLEGWSRALDLRDADTSGHTQRVAELAVRLARRMGLPDEDIVHLRRGALLHDIGKMAIPDEILRKQGPLDEREWAIMRQHPVFAYQLLAPIPFLRPALDVPYAHHERWDGTGYPRGLKGEEIPIAARIFAVVDVWDALRSRRPYGEPWSPDAARDYLRARAGTEFDPAVVEAFLALDPPPEADWPEAAPESRNDPSRTAPDSRRR